METKYGYNKFGYIWSIKNGSYHLFMSSNKSTCGKEYSFFGNTIAQVPVDKICKDCISKM
jgi:hypothetical protein